MNDPLTRHRRLVEQFPENELARFSLGKALFDLGHVAEAREHFSMAAARKPEWMVVQILLAKCELSLGRATEARAALERARALAIEQHHDGPLAQVNQLLAELASAQAP
jgi:predicted Zn-dependent protease